ncbi:cysteine proteinase [Agrocybe pediades]|nr:cysteine proteinase [Agrocybe pediades]
MTLPQPSETSSPNGLQSPELSPQLSRKRQRSLSMQSDSDASSSSTKRTVPDSATNELSVQSQRSDQLPSSLVDPTGQDIDAYMAEQDEEEIISAFAEPQLVGGQAMPPQSLKPGQRLKIVERGKKKRMEIGETWYLVARDWFRRWQKACSGEVDKEGPVAHEDIGPVDNSSLLDEFSNLQPSLVEGVDVEFVPQHIWELFVAWYGLAAQPLPRRIIARGALRTPTLELRPLRLKAYKLVLEISDSSIQHHWLTISAGETISKLCAELAITIPKPATAPGPFRIWRINSTLEDTTELEFPSSRLSNLDVKVVEESDKTLEEEGVESDDVFVVEYKTLNGWLMEIPKPVPQSTGFTFENPRPLFDSNDNFFNKMSNSFTSPTKATTAVFQGLGSPPSKPSTALTLPNKSIAKSIEPGTLGLGNMGNTCFMNSALQCLAHTKELTEYFLTGVYADELNRDNPLGMGGAIAEAFGSLLARIWEPTTSATSYSPREFKSQLQRFAPQFSGYQQHDSQELVAFLLDGLHEDLNRVIKKPYVEKPDWEGGGDVELVKLAQKSWEGYMLRNDSVIVDLFQGQYQSTLICPECQKVSITFDPFMYLTLPLPIQKKWKHSIYYIPWDLTKPHVKIPVEINRDASFKDLRVLLGRWMGAPAENLLTMEIFNNRFYKSLDDHLPVGEMTDNDVIVCFELPCNSRQNRAYKKQPDDPFILPVYLCDARPPMRTGMYSRNSNSPTLFGYPMVVAIDPEEATSVEGLYDFIASRLQRWTAQAKDLFTWEAANGLPDIDAEVPLLIAGSPPVDSVTEFGEDGSIVTISNAPESDIVDEKSMIIDEELQTEETDADAEGEDFEELRKVGLKRNIFELRLQINHKELGTSINTYSSNNRWESWESRIESSDGDSVLLRDDDALYCEFEEDKKAYYFGEGTRHEHALWDQWETFIHPEYEESKRAGLEKQNKGLTLQDCLDEFTKEEQLGEDDLWYCPQCKKHQQATKKFDIWKVPDILVVHLKRFSNNRSLRDKIDTHIDFPIEGLDLGNMVGERNIAKKLAAEGVDIEELKLGSLDEELVYDLYGVDEHIGGLGGGHYRAYASNHITEKWYHFDDSYVTPARASDSVNANAYLLFYRRRTNSPLGGKSYNKIEEAKSNPPQSLEPSQTDTLTTVTIGTQLPTPPNEETDYGTGAFRLPSLADLPSSSSASGHSMGLMPHDDDPWSLRRSGAGSNASSSISSPPAPYDDPPPDFDDYSYSNNGNKELIIVDQSYDYTHPSNKASPTSSNEAELDLDSQDTDLDIDETEEDVEEDRWNSSTEDSMLTDANGVPIQYKRVVGTWASRRDDDEVAPSPGHYDDDEAVADPFVDANAQKEEVPSASRKPPLIISRTSGPAMK